MSALAPRAKYPTAKFPTVGTSYTGVVCEPTEDRQARKYGSTELAFWPDGGPVMQTRIVLQLDNGEKAAVYAQGRSAHAVTKALVDANAPDIEVGGTLTIRFARTEPSKGGGQDAKVYEASYTPPADLAEDFDPADLA